MKEKLIVGKVILFRMECPQCGEMNLSGEKIFCCPCGYKYELDKNSSTRILCKSRRKKPSRKIQLRLIVRQQNKCFWCGRIFGIWYSKGRLFSQLKIHFDHMIAYNYLQSNPDENWVASCNICNFIKSDKIFESIEDGKLYLQSKWAKKLSKKEIIIYGEND